MDLSGITIAEPVSNEEIEKWEKAQEERQKEQFFITTSNVGKRYKDKTLNDFIADTDEKKEILEKVKQYIKENKPVLIFVPTISQSKSIYNLLKIFAKPGYFVNSKEPGRENIINNFRNGTYKYLVTTMVLERGVTIENLQVIIFDASNKVYSKETLIQISGRAGRKRSHPTGDVFLLTNKISSEMRSSIETIEYCNLNKDKTNDL